MCVGSQCVWSVNVCGLVVLLVVLHVVYIPISDVGPRVLDFRVKYYPSDPEKIREELTRYVLCEKYYF